MDRSRAARVTLGSIALGIVATTVAVVATRARRAPGSATGDRPGQRSPERLRAFVTRRFNPAVIRLGLVGGRRSPWCYVEHTGRRSGTVYRTPVLPMIVGDHAYIPLPYGVDVNWARNVRAAGHCRLQRRGLVLQLDEPAVVTPAAHPGLPGWYRPILERRGNRYLRLHVLATEPGTLDGTPDGTLDGTPDGSPAATRA